MIRTMGFFFYGSSATASSSAGAAVAMGHLYINNVTLWFTEIQLNDQASVSQASLDLKSRMRDSVVETSAIDALSELSEALF